MFGESLDDCVAPDDPVRVLERVLREMDRGAWEERYDGRRGQPAIHPRLIAGCILHGLMKGLRSTRALEDATRHRVDFTWFLERRTIDHATFSYFRKEFKAELKNLARQLARAIRAESAKAPLEVIIDGARLRANGDRRGALTAEALERAIAAVERELNEKLESLKDEGGEPDLRAADAETLEKEVEGLERRMEKYRKALAVARERDEAKRKKEGKKCLAARVPVTDPDSMILSNKEGGFAPNYTPVVAVDRATGAIVMNDVVEGADEASAVALAVNAAEDLFEKKPDRVLADASFATGENLEALEGNDIEAYVPTGTDFRDCNPANQPDPTQPVAPERWEQLPRRDGALARAAFIFDDRKDQYYCPMGKALARIGKSRRADDARHGCPGKTGCPLAAHRVKAKSKRRTLRRDLHPSSKATWTPYMTRPNRGVCPERATY